MELTVDLVLVVLGIGSAILSGWRGFLAAASALVGWVLGGWLGLALLPLLLGLLGGLPPWARSLMAILGVMVVAGVCSAVLGGLGAMLGRRVRRLRIARWLDTVLGAVVGLLTWAAAVWLVAGLAVSTGIQPVVQLAQSSRIVTALDDAVPIPPDAVFGAIGDAFAAAGAPRVFAPGQETVPTIGAPPSEVPAAVTKVAASIVEVAADEPGCGTRSTGSGWVVSAHRVVTNAHVVAGATTVSVLADGKRERFAATVVTYDPEVDLAILDVPGLAAAPIPLDPAALSAGDPAFAAGYPGGGAYTITPARVRGTIMAVGKDIYDQNTVERQVYSLRAEIRPGDSGGPLLDAAGEVAGVVFARSSTDGDTGYALTLAEVRSELDRAAAQTRPVSTGGCTAGG